MITSPPPAPDLSLRLQHWLGRFPVSDFLRPHLAEVLAAMPEPARRDLIEDPAFGLCDYEPGPGVVFFVPVAVPARGRPSRSVVLKRTLRHRPLAFVRWLIAHEFAHAHLRHLGRHPGEDPEHAADALAAEWGFPKPN